MERRCQLSWYSTKLQSAYHAVRSMPQPVQKKKKHWKHTVEGSTSSFSRAQSREMVSELLKLVLLLKEMLLNYTYPNWVLSKMWVCSLKTAETTAAYCTEQLRSTLTLTKYVLQKQFVQKVSHIRCSTSAQREPQLLSLLQLLLSQVTPSISLKVD